MGMFDCPKNYSDMSKKISNSVFVITLLELFVFAQTSSSFSNILNVLSFGTETEIAKIKLYVSYLIHSIYIFHIRKYF